MAETGEITGRERMNDAVFTPEQVVARFTTEFGPKIHSARVTERKEGKKKNPNYNIWIDLDREILRPAIRTLIEIHYPHLSVISGTDLGDEIRLLYHLSIYYGRVHGEYTVTFAVLLQKTDLVIPTISDLIPGAVFSEREKQEFLGVKVDGIPDGRRLFLPEDFPEGVFPWRKDGTGITENMVKNLWESKRPKDRPAPAAEDKEMCVLEGGESPGEREPGTEGS